MPVDGISGANALRATGVGHGSLPLGNSYVNLPLLYYVPGLGRTLLGISALAGAGLSTTFTSVNPSNPVSNMIVTDDTTGVPLLSVPCTRGLYTYQPPTTLPGTTATAIFQSDVLPAPPFKLRGYLAGRAGFLTNTYH